MLWFTFTPRLIRGVFNWLILASLAFAGFPTYADVTTGLIAYYPFNGNADDASGNDNNGTVYGATLIPDRFGNTDSAYSFNGIDNYIEAANSSSLQSPTTALAIAAWIYIENWNCNDPYNPCGDGYASILSKSPANSGYWGQYRFQMQRSGVWIGPVEGTYDTSITALPLNQWIHVAYSWDGSKVRFYTNSNFSAEYDSPGPLIVDDYPLVIGTEPLGGVEYMYGSLDDIRIYNRALTDADIQELYQEGANQLLTVTKIGNGNGTVTSDPAGINCGTDCSENYVSGTVVTLTATPTAGSIFAGWSGACSGTSPCSVTVDTDTAVTATFNPAPKPDFTITVITIAPAAPIASGTVTVTVTVKNQGAVAADGGTLRLWANQPAAQVCAASSGDANIPVGTLAAGASKPFAKAIAVGAGGIKTLRAFVDAACARVESNETNNQRTLSYRVTNRLALADFVVTAITLSPATPVVNGTFMASITVKNQGTVANLGGYLDVWINSPTVQACGAVGNFWVDVGSVAAGASKVIAISGIPAGVAGAKTLRAYVDSWCEIAESNDGNNQMIKAYTVQ